MQASIRPRTLVVAGLVLLVVALALAAQPLDNGDNFCGNAFVSRGSDHQYNGCDVRLAEQRAAAALIALSGVGLVVAAARATASSRAGGRGG